MQGQPWSFTKAEAIHHNYTTLHKHLADLIMKLSSLITASSALSLVSMLHVSLALPTKQLLQDREVKELLVGCKKVTASNNVSYDILVSWQEVGQATPDQVSTINAYRDGVDTSFLPPNIPVATGLDALLFSFAVVDGLVDDTAGAQFRDVRDMNATSSIEPFRIQLGAGGSPPTQFRIDVQRGADTGTGVLDVAGCLER